MAEHTNISWCDHTINWFIGCTKVSPACDGCYAEALMDKRYGRAKWGAPGQGAGTRVRTSAHNWNEPRRWDRKAALRAPDMRRPFVFSSSLSDIFDNQVDPAWRAEAFQVMRETPHLIYLLLTKRPQLIVKLSEAAGGLPANAAIGTTIEDQKRADQNVPHLLAAKRDLGALFAFLSCEPLLGPIDLTNTWPDHTARLNALTGEANHLLGMCDRLPPVDWVITGGETDQGGHQARPSNPQWFRDIRDQCASAGVAFHHKQNGEWVSVSEVEGPQSAFHEFDDGRTVRRVGKARSGRAIDGVTHDAFPAVL